MSAPMNLPTAPTRKPANIDLHVGRRLRALRLLRELSQEALAERIGLTFQQIQKYEKGVNRISASRLQQFADTLNVKPQFFFDADQDPGTHGSQNALPLELIFDRDVAAMVNAFGQITDAGIRRAIVDHIRSLAACCTEPRKADQ
ncbi:helix-turn-helix domain-containing protein [Hyphomicrobium sp. DMF-1]|uniref:helix-turn-helix domain-containing protein n=1 Tax=Hyphomicrobium sp. DMF-1 TaxID=3019544 RepID=UPI0022EBCE23|nr:helix-turn-helix transcriptional regulator [Hyphomicrobium sp. DMF-1]WBT37787.1 helix-turn-helix transcriptional regulator [Hyphomicrobium sp. DMF-1]